MTAFILALVLQSSWVRELSSDELERHAREIVRHVRPSGSSGEFAAIDYIVRTLRADGVPIEVFEFSVYVSDPVRASFRLESGTALDVPALTQAFSAPTPASGVVAEIVDLGRGTPEDYARVSSLGKLVLVDGLADPEGVQAAQNAGALGAVFAATADRVNEMTVGPIWGTPSPGDLRLLPRIPSVAVSRDAGAEIRRRLTAGPVRGRVTTEVSSGFKTLRLPVATITASRDPEAFVLLGGHIDAWHHGANDEGASNAAMVEIARIAHRHRGELARGLEVAWWPGHSNGRYAGSTWYADRFWIQLRDHALAYLNIDGVGQKEASRFTAVATAELEPFARRIVKDRVGVDPEVGRPGRNSDQAFFGVGLPALQFNHERTEDIGGYWWWHTPEDTFDKIDFEILTVDSGLYVEALHRLLTEPVPPFEASAAAAELAEVLSARTGQGLDLSDAMERARRLETLLKKIEASPAGSRVDGKFARRLVRALRPVLRVMYQERGPYHQDLALEHPMLPGLAYDPNPSEFARTHLVRETNRLLDHLDQALSEAEALERELVKR
jgi:N-acetylated-alpha-linked acidic dipeptidase